VSDPLRCPVDVLVVLTDDAGRLLLMQRAGDLYLPGHWCLPGGRVEPGEHAIAAAVRETKEEVGVTIDPGDLRFVGVTHHRPPHGDARVGFGFHTHTWTGTPTNREPDKCSQLGWFQPDTLPEPLMSYSHEIIRLYRANQPFSIHGWEGNQ
jgi:8-oxo-dGTP pyrophosphatase MutT (NUDIX family)